MAADKARNIRILIIGLAILVAGGLGLRYWMHGRYIESTDNAYVRADITSITPRVSGEVLAVPVHNNQAVKKGDLLLKIDSADYEARLANARAQIAVREAALAGNVQQKAQQASMIEEARAALVAQQADESRSKKDYDRANTLVEQGVATHQRLDTATATFKSAEANVVRAQASLKAASQQVLTLGADRERMSAELEAAKATAKLAEIDLASTELRAPVDGVIGDLAARVGERVNAGMRLLSVVPLAEIYVEANYKETQLTHMAIGQVAEVVVDAFPGRKISGHVDSVSPASGAEFSLLPPDNATGNFNKIVQRVPVKIVLDIPAELAGLLRPGMSVEAVIDTRTTPTNISASARAE